MVHKNEETLAYIKDKNDIRINMPCCLYMCKRSEQNEYENIYYDETNKNVKTIIEEKLNHNTFGKNYYFTTDPIDKNNILNLKRFAVFIDNTLYILNIYKPIEELDFKTNEEDDYDDNYKMKTERDYSCIYFFENGIQLWCIKNLSRFTNL